MTKKSSSLRNYLASPRLFLLLIIIVIAHLFFVAVYINQYQTARKAILRNQIIQKIFNVINLIYATPINNRQQALKALNDPDIQVRLTRNPRGLDKFQTISYRKIYQLLQQKLGNFALSIKLENHQWLDIRGSIFSHIWTTQLLLLVLEVMILGALLMVIWIANRYTRPLRDFKQLAERLGMDLHTRLLPINGPLVVREAADALNHMQKRISDLIKQRTQMLAAISHDLRTPITRIKLRLQTSQSDQLGNNQELIHDLTEMENMVNQTLQYIREDKISVNKKKTDVISLVRLVCDQLSDMGGNVNCYSRIQRAAAWIELSSFQRALQNLLNNANQYANTIIVMIHQQTTHIIIRIKDDGCGIPDNLLDKVFLPFYRVDTVKANYQAGVGLGLAITKEIIQAHQGQISLKNRRCGLCVTISIPLANNTCQQK